MESFEEVIVVRAAETSSLHFVYDMLGRAAGTQAGWLQEAGLDSRWNDLGGRHLTPIEPVALS